jgi:Lsr2
MAVREVRSCDLDGVDGATPHVLAYDGVHYALDLCGKDEEGLEKAVAKFLEAATEISESEARKLLAATDTGPKVDPAVVRAWALAQKPPIQLGVKGRIPRDVMDKYLAANPPQES